MHVIFCLFFFFNFVRFLRVCTLVNQMANYNYSRQMCVIGRIKFSQKRRVETHQEEGNHLRFSFRVRFIYARARARASRCIHVLEYKTIRGRGINTNVQRSYFRYEIPFACESRSFAAQLVPTNRGALEEINVAWVSLNYMSDESAVL